MEKTSLMAKKGFHGISKQINKKILIGAIKTNSHNAPWFQHPNR